MSHQSSFFYPGWISSRKLKSEWLWVNQEDVLTPDEKLVDVPCVDLAIRLGLFLPTDLWTLSLPRDFVFSFNRVWQLGRRPAVPSLARTVSGLLLGGLIPGAVLLFRLVTCWALLELQLLKELYRDQSHINICGFNSEHEVLLFIESNQIPFSMPFMVSIFQQELFNIFGFCGQRRPFPCKW